MILLSFTGGILGFPFSWDGQFNLHSFQKSDGIYELFYIY